MKIKVIIKQPGQKPYVTHVSNSLENLQKTVGGYIETVNVAGIVIICDEEGRIKDLPFNCNIGMTSFVGPVIFAGIKGDEFASLPCEFRTFKKLFPQLFEEATL